MKFKMGAFQIRNTANGKIFVGSSVNLDAIWNRHKLQLELGSHPNAALQNDWKQYGAESFKYEILDVIVEKETETRDYPREVKTLEEMYLEKLQPYAEKGYNIKTGS